MTTGLIFSRNDTTGLIFSTFLCAVKVAFMRPAVWMFLADTWCQTSAHEMVMSRKQKKEERKKDRAERSPESETALV